MTELEFGRIQIRIMHFLWEQKRATAREITKALNEYELIDHRNVQTILRRLENKGAIGYELDERTHIYYPLVKNEKVRCHEVHTFLDRLYQGSVSSLVSAMVNHKYVTIEELKKIFSLFEEKDR